VAFPRIDGEYLNMTDLVDLYAVLFGASGVVVFGGGVPAIRE
jgi:hypothetical protein